MLKSYPTLSKIVSFLDEYLKRTYLDYFGDKATHPVASLKPFKVIHDNLWGANRFSWRELVLRRTSILL